MISSSAIQPPSGTLQRDAPKQQHHSPWRPSPDGSRQTLTSPRPHSLLQSLPHGTVHLSIFKLWPWVEPIDNPNVASWQIPGSEPSAETNRAALHDAFCDPAYEVATRSSSCEQDGRAGRFREVAARSWPRLWGGAFLQRPNERLFFLKISMRPYGIGRLDVQLPNASLIAEVASVAFGGHAKWHRRRE
jgi:hypothetical protein